MDKRILALGGLVVLLGLSGCMGLITGESLEFEASPAAVSNESAAEAGYTLQQYDATKINRTVEVMGVERDIRISLHQAVYGEQMPENVSEDDIDESAIQNRSEFDGDVDPSAIENGSELDGSLMPSAVTVVSLPDAQVFGESVNPLVRLPTDELVERFASSSEGNLQSLEKAGERQVTLLGSETTMTEFDGELGGEQGSTSARVSVAKLSHDGDVVVILAVDPAGEGNSTEALDEFIGMVEHPTDAPN